MNNDTTPLGEILAIAETAKLRSYLAGQIEDYELIGRIVESLKDVAEIVGDTLEEELSEPEFQTLCRAELSNRVLTQARATRVDVMAAAIALRHAHEADTGA